MARWCSFSHHSLPNSLDAIDVEVLARAFQERRTAGRFGIRRKWT